MSDMLTSKGPAMQGPKDVVVERLRRRVNNYRKHHDDFVPRFEHTVNGLNDQQKQETQHLRQRFLESKPKKSAKNKEKNKDGSNNSGSHKLQKRQLEDIGIGSGVNGSENYEPPTKVTVCGGVNGNVALTSNSSNFKHHQVQSPSQDMVGSNTLSNSKTMGGANLKQGNGPSGPPIPSPISDPRTSGGNGSCNSSFSSGSNVNIDYKQEPNSRFVDLDECAAALEKDAAENGSMMSGLMGMGDLDTLKDLISEISDNPDFMKDFEDFDDDRNSHEDNLHGARSANMSSNPNHMPSTNATSCSDPSNANFTSGHGHSRTPPVAPITPTTSSPPLSNVKIESDLNNTGHASESGGCGNRGLSHCAGPSPAAASTASPLASQLSSHHPSQTPPSSSVFDSASPSGAQSQQNPLTPNSNASNYCSNSNTAHNSVVSGINSKGTRIPYTSPSNLTLDSPAAQTLKQMAEQHQHKAQLGMNTFKPNPGSNLSPARSPFNSGSDNYSGFSASGGEFSSGGPPLNPVNSNGSNSTNFSNVPIRNQSNNISSVSDNMTFNVPIKQEANAMYSPQRTFSPSMDNNKRNNVNMNHVHHSQQPPQPPPQTQQQQHKMPTSNSPRMPNSVMNSQSQQPPLYSNKSFTHANPSGNQMGPSVNASVNVNQMTNSSNVQQFMNRAANPGMNSVSQNNFPPTSHSGFQGSVNNHNHIPVQNNPGQPNPLGNPSGSMPVSTSGSQQMGPSPDLKNTPMGGSMPPQNYYYQNQCVSPHGQMHLQQQTSQSQASDSSVFMNSNGVQSNSPNMLPNGSTHGQTINFTQQHLRMSTGITQSPAAMNRMVGPGTMPPMPRNAGMTRMGMPTRINAPPSGCPGMNEPGMNPRMEMQHRLIRQQQVRGHSIPPQQLLRPSGPNDMMGPQQMMSNQGPMVNMNRFPSNPPAPTGPGRPGPAGGPSMMSGGPGQGVGSNMSNLRIQQSGYGPGHGMTSMCGTSGNMSMNTNMVMNNNMNMPMRRMPTYGQAAGVGSNSPTNMPNRNPVGVNQSMSLPAQSQQQSMGSASEWMGMSDSNVRNYPGANIPQPPPQSMRPNAASSGFHQGMGMQMGQQQQPHSMVPMQRGDGSMCGMAVGSQPGITGNQHNAMGYNQQQQMPVGGNPGNYSQSPMTSNKMPQSQQTMCVSSNYTIKSGGGVAISSSPGSGGTMVCANTQSMNPLCNSMKSSISDMTNQDFGFDLLENITGNDASNFNSDSDFLSSFESNPNYSSILDSL